MDCETVYRVSQEWMKIDWLFAVIPVVVGLILVVYAWSKRNLKRRRKRAFLLSTVAFGGFGLVFAAVVAPGQIGGYYKVMKRYRTGSYKRVSGPVEHFVPMPRHGHAYESFTVQGVKFSYSDFDASYYGFNNSKSHGGPIRGDGQFVKIGYVAGRERNEIVKLEICRPKENQVPGG